MRTTVCRSKYSQPYKGNLKYSSVSGCFEGPHIESLLLLSAGRTKGIRGPHAARGPHFAHPWYIQYLRLQKFKTKYYATFEKEMTDKNVTAWISILSLLHREHQNESTNLRTTASSFHYWFWRIKPNTSYSTELLHLLSIYYSFLVHFNNNFTSDSCLKYVLVRCMILYLTHSSRTDCQGS